MRLAHVLHQSARPATEHGVTIGTPVHYDLFTNLFFLGRRRAAFQTLVRASGVRPGQRALDVGCGTGYLARLLAEAVGRSGHVDGIDAAPEMVEYATRRARPIPQCEFQVASAEALPFPDDRFDTVVSSLFLHHLPEHLQLAAVGEMQRVLRPGGTLLLADFRVPRGMGWRLIAELAGTARMERATPGLEELVVRAGCAELASGEVRWMRYVRAVKAA
jgi:ubiquinone/menaquinone biosynthesis C-methylase UbiE